MDKLSNELFYKTVIEINCLVSAVLQTDLCFCTEIALPYPHVCYRDYLHLINGREGYFPNIPELSIIVFFCSEEIEKGWRCLGRKNR